MAENQTDPSISEQERAMKNVEMMNYFQSLKRKYTAREAGGGRSLSLLTKKCQLFKKKMVLLAQWKNC